MAVLCYGDNPQPYCAVVGSQWLGVGERRPSLLYWIPTQSPNKQSFKMGGLRGGCPYDCSLGHFLPHLLFLFWPVFCLYTLSRIGWGKYLLRQGSAHPCVLKIPYLDAYIAPCHGERDAYLPSVLVLKILLGMGHSGSSLCSAEWGSI